MARFHKRRGLLRSAGAALFLAAAWTSGSPAHAQGPDDGRSKANALFEDAKKLMDQDAFADACPKLAESEKLDPQVGTMLNLALCYESLGKTASACSTWRDAAAGAAQKVQSDRERWALEHVQRVCPRVPVVTVDVAEQPGRERVELTLNDAPLSRASWGQPMPLDPGEYVLRATGDGLRPWSSRFTIGERSVPALTVPVLAAPELPPVTTAPGPPVVPGPGNAIPGRDRLSPPRSAAWVTGGVGLAILGVSAAFGLAALTNEHASLDDRNCVSNRCNATGTSDRTRAIDDARISDATLALGAGAVAFGALLWLIAPRAAEHGHGVTLRPSVAQGAWSLAAGGEWP
jgi:hypothetical protein